MTVRGNFHLSKYNVTWTYGSCTGSRLDSLIHGYDCVHTATISEIALRIDDLNVLLFIHSGLDMSMSLNARHIEWKFTSSLTPQSSLSSEQ